MKAKTAPGLAKALAASLALWSAFVVVGLKSLHLCLAGSEADVPARIDSTILLLYRGFDVYRGPVARLGERSRTPFAAGLTARYVVLIAYLVLASLAFTYFSFSGQLFIDLAKELWG